MSYGPAVSIFVLTALLAAPAAAQEDIIRQRIRPGQDSTVQSTITMSLPFDPSKDVAAQHEQALRALYQMAARSCAMVTETVADECEMGSITSNVRSDEAGSRSNRLTVTGQIAMKVTFKANTAAMP